MAKLYNYLVKSGTNRINDMFIDRPVEVSAGHVRAKHSEHTTGMRLTFQGSEEVEKDRTYSVILDASDIGKVAERMLNVTGQISLGNWGIPEKPTNSDHNYYEQLLLDHGIKFTWYRYPAPSFADGSKRWYWSHAINRYHAEHQLARILKDFKPQLLEEVAE
jgi:hypothetical protein